MDEFSPKTNDWRSPKVIVPIVGMVLVAGIVVIAILRDRLVSQPQWQVQVTGQGRVAYHSDTAIVTLGVQVERVGSAEVALRQLNDRVSRALATVKALGIAADDIQTQSYTVYSQYDYRDGVSWPAGYTANQQLTVKVRQLAASTDRLAQVVAAAARGGINQVLGITFDVSNLADLKQQARLAAIADARARASSLAQAAGVRLGKVVGWWENVVQAPGPLIPSPFGGDGKGGAATSPQLPAASQEVVVEMSLSYQVK